MRYFAFSAILLFVVLSAVQGQERRCKKQSECNDDECCLKRLLLRNVCTKRGGEGSDCTRIGVEGLFGKEVFIGNCPCQTGLECRELTREEGGEWDKFLHVKCRKPLNPPKEPEEKPKE